MRMTIEKKYLQKIFKEGAMKNKVWVEVFFVEMKPGETRSF